MSAAASLGQLKMVGASAGSGKTYRLTEEVKQAVDPESDDRVALEGLVAVTYTKRAAAELAARIRRSLIRAGAAASAQRLPLAYLGTVHAVCLRLVQEFAVDAGLSPRVQVLTGNEQHLLAQALEWKLSAELRQRLQTCADALQIHYDTKTRRTDWLVPVKDVMALARSNRIAPAALPAMAERCLEGLLGLMGKPELDGDQLDRELVDALEDAREKLSRIDDGVKKTAGAIETVEHALDKHSRGELLWSDWVRLQKLEPAKPVLPVVAPLKEVAGRVRFHPRLQQQISDFVHAIYEAAQTGLQAYEAWKLQRRVVDFADMVDRAITLVEHPDVARELSQRLELLVVDEFQDTSPLQLSLFVRLHQLAGRSTWVGDRKQCIFEFTGADPALMEAMTEWARRAGGATEQLPANWRSRPELVEACNRLFSAAFAQHGYSADEVEVQAERETPAGLAALPPLGLWQLEPPKGHKAEEALAEGVKRLLDAPDKTPVVDRNTGEVRNLRGSDIAVLLATNVELERLATALARRGVRSAIARAGLLETPEGTLVAAALRRLVDPRDRLANAVVEALTGFGGVEPEAWLDARIASVAARRAATEAGAETQQAAKDADHTEQRETPLAELLSPTEAVDNVIAELDRASLCTRWPDPEQRRGNLEALRARAVEYEERCAQFREAGTVVGLLRYFEEAAKEVVGRDETRANDEQHVGSGPDAVTLVTYHRAKGLEWPVVVLGSLGRAPRRSVFDVSPESDGEHFDAAEPLAGRWIRYWPWPFGPQQKCHLADAAAASDYGLKVAAHERRERVRLLYVGFTRARDHLILAAGTAKKGLAVTWLDELADAQRKPLLQLPASVGADEIGTIGIRGLDGSTSPVQARHWKLGVGSETAQRSGHPENRRWLSRPDAPQERRDAYRIAPSRAATDWPTLAPLEVLATTTIGKRLPLGKASDTEWDVVGNAVHAFLAADLPGLTREQRLARAARLLETAGAQALIQPDSLLGCSNALQSWVDAKWPGATWRREVPISGVIATPHGKRRIEGAIDLLLETPEGVAIIDHKTYPGPASAWPKKALEFAPQLAAYSEVLTMAGRSVLGAWLHFPVGGGVVELAKRSPE